MKKALIGYTGFVGSNLCRQGDFTDFFNSSNIGDIAGQTYDEIWCAGVRAVKWQANKNPEADKASIEPLLNALKTAHADRFVLISTVDVFMQPSGKDESHLPVEEGLHPYGLHRLAVEKFVTEKFPRHHIVRLPGLFGKGLKKNIIYDFLHNNQVEKIHCDARFQFYDLEDIYRDCSLVKDNNLPLVHFAVEPVSVAEVGQLILGRPFTNRPEEISPARYDFHTRYAPVFGGHNPYIQNREQVLARIEKFVREKA